MRNLFTVIGKRGLLIVWIAIFSYGLTFAYPGCDDPTADNYDVNATSDNRSCVYCGIAKLFDPPGACCDDVDASGVCDYDEVCVYPVAHGCTDPDACNYAPSAVVDVGNCIVCGDGHTCAPNGTSCCEDPDNNNICGTQPVDPSDSGGSDPSPVGGCMQSTACNYDVTADYDDRSCVFPQGCNDRCPGDPGEVAYLDACGVCDSDTNNDNTTCTPDDTDTCEHTPGTTCDDGNPDTPVSFWNEDCACVGEVFTPGPDCNGVVGGSDLPGASCDDADPCTVNDYYASNCECVGMFEDADYDSVCDVDDQCPNFDDTLIGSSCSDGDPCTSDDTWQDSCLCVGIEEDSDGDGVCDAYDQCPGLEPGNDCDDGNVDTIHDQIRADCSCSGILAGDLDCLDVLNGPNGPGTVCDDNDVCTGPDYWDDSCDCVGAYLDADEDTVCNVDDQCPGFDDTLLGASCDDGDPCTVDDVYDATSCRCKGIFKDTDADDVCNYYDQCADFDDSFIGKACDDGDEMTEYDLWGDDCRCVGTEIVHEAAPEDPFSYPTVPGALYIEVTDSLVVEEFEDVVQDFVIDDIYQPFEDLELSTYRIEFDPARDHQDLINALQEKFKEKLVLAEPIPLVQFSIEQTDQQKLDKQILPSYLSAIGYGELIAECPQLFSSQQKKIRVAIIDNGYQAHEDLDANVVYTYDVADRDDDVYITDTAESCAHGNIDAGLVGAVSTNTLGIISAGYNPELILIKAAPDGRPCTDITAGIEGLSKAANYADIINISRGINFDSKVLRKVVQKIIDKGIVIVAAAGNFSTDQAFYPAVYPGVIAVGSVGNDLQPSSFSNYGAWLDISAPGEDMLSTALENEYTKVSGTSQSAPLVAGWLAFLLSQGESVDALYQYVTPLAVSNMGVGVISARSYCQATCSPDYSSVDYNGDATIDSQDAKVLRNWIANEFVSLECVENFEVARCCPPESYCDVNDDLSFDAEDLGILQKIIDGGDYDILGDGIDNDCDGLIDDEMHGAAPVAETASWRSRNSYLLLIGLVLFFGSLGVYLWRKKKKEGRLDN